MNTIEKIDYLIAEIRKRRNDPEFQDFILKFANAGVSVKDCQTALRLIAKAEPIREKSE